MGSHLFEELIVVKRSGQRVSFNGLKIAIAIKKAFDSVNAGYNEKDINKIYEDTLLYIEQNYQDRKTINVEDIQDIIENILSSSKYKQVFKEFSEYRIRRAESRKAFSIKQQHKFVKAIEQIGNMDQTNSKPNEIIFNFGKTIALEYTKSYIIDNKYVRSHEEGKIFIHHFPFFNLGYLGATHIKLNKILDYDNCFYELLSDLIALKREIHDEIAIDSIDELLTKYILKEFKSLFKLKLEKYLKIAGYLEFINFKKIDELIEKENSIKINFIPYNDVFINISSRILLNEAYEDTIMEIDQRMWQNISKLLLVLNNNNEDNSKYVISLGSSSINEAKLIQNIVLNTLKKVGYLKNVAVVFKIKKEIDAEIIKDLSEVIAKGCNIRLSFINNGINKDCIIDTEYFSNGLRIFDNSNVPCSVTGKSNVANTSINMARLGIKYQHDNELFFSEIDEILDLVKSELLFVFETIGDKKKNNYDVLFKSNIYDDEKLEDGQSIRKVIKNGTININLIGLKECALSIDKDNYYQIITSIIKYIKDKVDNIKNETKLNWTLSAINYLEVSEYLIDIDKTAYGLIDKITKKERYENLGLINNLESMSEVINYQKLLSGGFLIELNLNKNTSAKKIEEIIQNLVNSGISFINIKTGSDEL